MYLLYSQLILIDNFIINNTRAMQQDEHQTQKVEKILLELNKTGLSYLKYLQYKEAIDFFKKAEKIVQEELMINTQNQKINQLAGVTFNNLACYYKKTKRPKVALGYLKKSLQLEVYKINDWVSTGSTHLNICAIYSYLGRHEEAVNHVNLALELLQKKDYEKDDFSQQAKSYWNIKMLCYYNKAIEEQHLKYYQQSLKTYQVAKDIAKIYGSKNVGIILNCDEAIVRIETILANLKKKMMNIFLKKKQQEETGHYNFMRHHKVVEHEKGESKQVLQKVRRFSLYKSKTPKNKEMQQRKIFFSKQKENNIEKIQRKSTSSRFKSLNEYLHQKHKSQPSDHQQ